MADLAGLKPIERKVEINHPATDEPIGIRVALVSMDDPKMIRVRRRIIDERMRLEQRGKIFKAEEIEKNNNDVLFTAMTGWEWYNPTGNDGDSGYDADAMPNFNGEIPEFNRKNVVDVFNELPWFAQQISTAVGETKDFFQN